jgi:hypothetical protein
MSFPVGRTGSYQERSIDYRKIIGLNIIPANELSKYKIPKYLFGGYKIRFNYKYNKEETIYDCGYAIPPELQSRVFDIFMSISLQQKNIERTVAVFEYLLSHLESSLKKFTSLNIQDAYKNVKRDVSSELTDLEFDAIVRAGIIIKIRNAFNAMYGIGKNLLSYLLDTYDYSYDYHKYIRKQIGKLSLKNTDGNEIVDWYSRNIDNLDDKIDPIASIYIDAIKKYLEDEDRKRVERQMRIDEERRKEEAEKQRQLAEIEAFRIFLSDYCGIRSEHIDIIMRSVPRGTNCKTIYNVTNEFLNKYVPVASIKNITDALAGVPNKYGQCPLCHIYNSGGPSCTNHGVYKLSKSDDKCSICMVNKIDVIVKCNHEFCKACIDEWLTGNSTCPICRAGLN